MSEKIAYLDCKITKGIFEQEKWITFRDIFRKEIRGFFPNSSIKDGKLEIIIIKEGRNNVLITTRYAINNPGGYGFFNGSRFYVHKNLIKQI